MRDIRYAQALLRRASSRMNVQGNAVAHKVDGQSQAHLGGILRAVYQPVAEEALPERVRNLLDALDGRDMKWPVSRAADATTGPRSPEAEEPASSGNTDMSLSTPQLAPRRGLPDEGRR